MTHNISTSGEASGTRASGQSGIPVVGPMWQNPVLTIRDTVNEMGVGRQRQVTILFHGGGHHHPGSAHLVLNPWHADNEGPTVHIEGEDLFALRELLNELPETAFKRPKDPVIKPDVSQWTDGDIVRFHGGDKPDAVWTRHLGRWHTPGNLLTIADREVDAVTKRAQLPGAPVGRAADVLRQQSA